MGEGQEGVRPMAEHELHGLMVESRELDPETPAGAPGGHRVRGLEANTAMTDGFANDVNLTGTVCGNELDIGSTGFGSPEDRAQENDIMPPPVEHCP